MENNRGTNTGKSTYCCPVSKPPSVVGQKTPFGEKDGGWEEVRWDKRVILLSDLVLQT